MRAGSPCPFSLEEEQLLTAEKISSDVFFAASKLEMFFQ
jgi:hypothetical protein